MKRDMELIRKLLIDISEGKAKQELSYDLEEDMIYEYHLDIMQQADLITLDKQGFMGGIFVGEPRLTWTGNDYLDSIANETVWSKTKEVIKNKGLEASSMPLDILIDLAKQQFKNWIGID